MRSWALEQSVGRCVDCRRHYASQVHQISYWRLWDPWPGDVAALCKPCHIERHERGEPRFQDAFPEKECCTRKGLCHDPQSESDIWTERWFRIWSESRPELANAVGGIEFLRATRLHTGCRAGRASSPNLALPLCIAPPLLTNPRTVARRLQSIEHLPPSAR